MVQPMLMGEADRAVHLVGDVAAPARRLAGADLGDRGGKERIVAGGDRIGRVGHRHRRGGDLLGEQRELLLDRLDLADRAAELHAVIGILRRQGQGGFERARHLGGAADSAQAVDEIDIDGPGQRRHRAGGQRQIEAHGVARFAGEIDAAVALDPAGRDERDKAARDDSDAFRRARPGHAARHTREVPAAIGAAQAEDIVALDRRQGQRPGLHLEAGGAQRETREHRLGERQRHGVAAGGAHDGDGVGETAELGERIRKTGILGRLPQLTGPGAGFRCVDDCGGRVIGEETVGGVEDEGVGHRRPPSAGRARGR